MLEVVLLMIAVALMAAPTAKGFVALVGFIREARQLKRNYILEPPDLIDPSVITGANAAVRMVLSRGPEERDSTADDSAVTDSRPADDELLYALYGIREFGNASDRPAVVDQVTIQEKQPWMK